ncbi:MAG TPA: membrane protein insertase YidC, partial [Bacteroidia bacterium]|nr:membrane protein insertase YidC [Bacteroidia bacterium]
MDRNSVAGLVLIGIILISYSFFTAPTAEQLAEEKKTQDSIALVAKQKADLQKAAVAKSLVADTA